MLDLPQFTPITDAVIGQPSTAQVQTQQPYPPPKSFGWDDAARGIESGSWAVVLMSGVIFFLLRKPASEFIRRQMELMNSLKETQVTQAQNISQINLTQDKTAIALEKIISTLDLVAANDARVASTLEDHSTAIVKIVDSIALNQETIKSLGENKDQIMIRQAKQILLLEAIESKLTAPIDVHPVKDNKKPES